MSPGILLIHGYTGSPESLRPLADQLSILYGNDSIANITLPGHGNERPPEFNRERFIRHISGVAETLQSQGRKIIIIGHSTGGVLALAAIAEGLLMPDLLVLATVPKGIDSGSLQRWTRHRAGKDPIPLTDIAGMASLINYTGGLKMIGDFPVLIMNGENDELVLPQDAYAWSKGPLTGRERTVIITGAGHDLFHGPHSAFATDIILRAVSDLSDADVGIIERIKAAEPEVADFIAASPGARRHLSLCPSGQRLMKRIPSLQPLSISEPVFANIEITTRCNLKCRFCARAMCKREARDMDQASFRRIIDLLPNACRVTLVGLGEPLLHPHILDIIEIASSQGRRTGLVTNAMCLDADLSRGLVESGLQSITFSIDAPNQELASRIRPGTDLDRVINNIREFVGISNELRPISKAVFSAVSVDTVIYLKDLTELISGLGVNVLMLTDLNYEQNLKNTLFKNADEEIKRHITDGVRHAFQKKLPVLSVNGLEEFGLTDRYKDFLLFPPDRLCRRSSRHERCFSPWQTLPVDVGGNVTVCDCLPEEYIGNIFTDPFSEIWNGERMAGHRRKMLGDDPPAECLICPRF